MLYLVDPIDEYAIQHVTEYDGKKLQVCSTSVGCTKSSHLARQHPRAPSTERRAADSTPPQLRSLLLAITVLWVAQLEAAHARAETVFLDRLATSAE